MRLKTKIVIFLVLALLVIYGLYKLLQAVNYFFDHYRFVFKPPVEIKLNQPLTIEKRKIKIETIAKEVGSLPQPKTPVENYICQKFGVADCKIALAIAKSESGLKETSVNINTNGTIDIGIFQINSVHWSKPKCHPKFLFDAYKNTDCAFEIWKVQGWTPWVAFTSGNFVRSLK